VKNVNAGGGHAQHQSRIFHLHNDHAFARPERGAGADLQPAGTGRFPRQTETLCQPGGDKDKGNNTEQRAAHLEQR